jgi:hypothetical protein
MERNCSLLRPRGSGRRRERFYLCSDVFVSGKVLNYFRVRVAFKVFSADWVRVILARSELANERGGGALEALEAGLSPVFRVKAQALNAIKAGPEGFIGNGFDFHVRVSV